MYTEHLPNTGLQFYRFTNAISHVVEHTKCSLGLASRLEIAYTNQKKKKICGLSPRTNYTERATAACWRS
jgi:hypothetical protein